jgi:large subunit ribosomal protein L32
MRKMSRSITRHRRAVWTLTPAALVSITAPGRRVRVPRPLVRAAQRGLLDLDSLPPVVTPRPTAT